MVFQHILEKKDKHPGSHIQTAAAITLLFRLAHLSKECLSLLILELVKLACIPSVCGFPLQLPDMVTMEMMTMVLFLLLLLFTILFIGQIAVLRRRVFPLRPAIVVKLAELVANFLQVVAQLYVGLQDVLHQPPTQLRHGNSQAADE